MISASSGPTETTLIIYLLIQENSLQDSFKPESIFSLYICMVEQVEWGKKKGQSPQVPTNLTFLSRQDHKLQAHTPVHFLHDTSYQQVPYNIKK